MYRHHIHRVALCELSVATTATEKLHSNCTLCTFHSSFPTLSSVNDEFVSSGTIIKRKAEEKCDKLWRRLPALQRQREERQVQRKPVQITHQYSGDESYLCFPANFPGRLSQRRGRQVSMRANYKTLGGTQKGKRSFFCSVFLFCLLPFCGTSPFLVSRGENETAAEEQSFKTGQ